MDRNRIKVVMETHDNFKTTCPVFRWISCHYVVALNHTTKTDYDLTWKYQRITSNCSLRNSNVSSNRSTCCTQYQDGEYSFGIAENNSALK